MIKNKYIAWFEQISLKDLAYVGGKNASLGEMITNLKTKDVSVPKGFAITTTVYERFLSQNNIDTELLKLLELIKPHDLAHLENISLKIQKLIKDGEFHDEFKKELHTHYQVLSEGDSNFRVAVRSSASMEDLPSASFAGQQESFFACYKLR